MTKVTHEWEKKHRRLLRGKSRGATSEQPDVQALCNAFLARHDMTHAELADLIGRDRTTIWRIANGQKTSEAWRWFPQALRLAEMDLAKEE